MWARPIPRFSPTFSPRELRAAVRSFLPAATVHVADFERAFADYIGVGHAVMVPSARMGVYLLLQAWGIKPGDEVLLPSLTYFSVPSIMVSLGVKPVFVDVGRNSYLMDPADLERKITSRSVAAVPTHLYGLPCDMDPILAICRKSGLKVIEDVAQATGARYKGQRVGSFGDASYYTFGLTKNITTLQGGMLTTSDDALAAKLREITHSHTPLAKKPLVKDTMVGAAMMMITRPWIYPFTLHPMMLVQGRMGHDYLEAAFGEPEVLYEEVPDWFFHSAPTPTQAAVGLAQLQRIDGLNGLRAHHGRYLLEHLAHADGMILPRLVSGAEPIFMSFPIQVNDVKRVQAHLLAEGVDTARGYMKDCSTLPIFAGKVGGSGTCPNAKKIEEQILHLPVHPNLSRGDLSHLVEAARRAVGGVN